MLQTSSQNIASAGPRRCASESQMVDAETRSSGQRCLGYDNLKFEQTCIATDSLISGDPRSRGPSHIYSANCATTLWRCGVDPRMTSRATSRWAIACDLRDNDVGDKCVAFVEQLAPDFAKQRIAMQIVFAYLQIRRQCPTFPNVRH